MKKLFWLGFILFAFWKLTDSDEIKLGPGVKVAEAPKQTVIQHPEAFNLRGFAITPLANFDIKAKVLSKTHYYLGEESDLSPLDFALGWQNMSDEQVLDQIEISQSNRWYHWRVKQFPIPRREIETQSANMHLIPADERVDKQLEQVKQGQIISLHGKLVRVDGEQGWHWQSSLTREDTGAGACEVIYVEEIQVIQGL